MCCDQAECLTEQRCDITGFEGACVAQKALAEECGADTDCVSDNCEVAGGNHPLYPACEPSRTPTPKEPPRMRYCYRNDECPPGLLCNLAEGACCQRATCPGGMSCTVDNSGLCKVLPTPTPTLLPNGAPCRESRPVECASGHCIDATCCNVPVCEGADRCNIFQFEGQCVAPLSEGSECRKNADCESGLQCLTDAIDGVQWCRSFRHTHPTCPPTPTPSPTPRASDDGCTIAPTSSHAVWPFVCGVLGLVWRRRHVR